jgi:hypothetical protein
MSAIEGVCGPIRHTHDDAINEMQRGRKDIETRFYAQAVHHYLNAVWWLFDIQGNHRSNDSIEALEMLGEAYYELGCDSDARYYDDLCFAMKTRRT